MRTAQLLVISAIAFLGIPDAPRAQTDPVTAIAGGEAMRGVIDNLRSSIIEILNKLDDSVGSATFVTRMNLQVLLGDLEYQGSKLADKTFSQISAEQQKFFSNARATVREIEMSGGNVAEKADQVLKRSEFLLGMVPFSDKEPRLKSRLPRAIISSEIKDGRPLEVKFDGSWLAHGNPELIIKESACKISDQTEVSARFSCTGLAAPAASGGYLGTLEGSVRFEGQNGFWRRLASWFGGSLDKKSYPVSIDVLPDQFATLTVVAQQENFSEKRNERSQPFDTGARHCISGPSTTVNISTSGPEWRLDPASIRVHVASSNGSGAHQINNVTTSGFQLRAWASNSGSCGPFGIKDARGWHNGTIFWAETTQVSSRADVNVGTQTLLWGERKVVKLPERTRAFLASVRMFDGKIREFSATSRDEFLFVDADINNLQVAFEGSPLKSAFKRNLCFQGDENADVTFAERTSIVSKLNDAIVKTLANPATRKRLADIGQELFAQDQLTPESLATLHRDEIETWWPIIKASSIEAN
jgi:hypothetical protein